MKNYNNLYKVSSVDLVEISVACDNQLGLFRKYSPQDDIRSKEDVEKITCLSFLFLRDNDFTNIIYFIGKNSTAKELGLERSGFQKWAVTFDENGRIKDKRPRQPCPGVLYVAVRDVRDLKNKYKLMTGGKTLD